MVIPKARLHTIRINHIFPSDGINDTTEIGEQKSEQRKLHQRSPKQDAKENRYDQA